MNPDHIGMQAVLPPRQKRKKKEYINPILWIFLAILVVTLLGYGVFVFYSYGEGLGFEDSVSNFFAGLLEPLIQSR